MGIMVEQKPHSLATVCQMKKRINPEPDYQRPAVWSRAQKALLVDSILRGYDIPKMYWHEIHNGDRRTFDVIDGQQRLRAIWGYKNNEFSLPDDASKINEKICAGLKYDELPTTLQEIFDDYQLTACIVRGVAADDQEVGEMFLRLQNGTTLKAQEKRNAIRGPVRDAVKSLAKHSFFSESCSFKNTRYAFDHLAAQLLCLELEGKECDIATADLDKIYRRERLKAGSVNNVKGVLQELQKVFPERTPELKRYNVIILYLLISSLKKDFVFNNAQRLSLRDWFIEFENERALNNSEDTPEENRNTELLQYKTLTSHLTDTEASITKRLKIVSTRFFATVKDLRKKDSVRQFTQVQRQAIYYRDNGKCQLKIKCRGGDRLPWGDGGWEADHIKPYSEGGETTVANGQVTCVDCNRSKGSRPLS